MAATSKAAKLARMRSASVEKLSLTTAAEYRPSTMTLAAELTAGDVAAIIVAVIAAVFVAFVCVALTSLTRTMRSLREAVEQLRRGAPPVGAHPPGAGAHAAARAPRGGGLPRNPQNLSPPPPFGAPRSPPP